LAVPESPQNNAGFLIDIIWLRSQAYLIVSTVGTKIAENFLFAGATYSGTFSSHLTKVNPSILKKFSYSELDGMIRPLKFFKKSLNFSLSLSTIQPPRDQVKQKIKNFSSWSNSSGGFYSGSGSIESTISQSCLIRFRFVLGVMKSIGGRSSSVPSFPSKILSMH
jgi:hypothetical protein